MASIPGLVFVILGAFVSVVSYIKMDELKIFFYAGLAFFIYGLLKIFINSALGKNRKERKKALKEINLEKKEEKPAHQRMQPAHFQHQNTAKKFCQNCGMLLQGNERFCPYCGARQFQ